MKKKLFLVFFGLAVCGVFLNAQTQTLDETILRAALRIGADLPADATVAVIHFRSGAEKLNDYVINELHGAILRNRRLTPVKPGETQLQSIRDELRFNEAGEIDGESAQSIGQLLKVAYLLSGSIESSGSGYEILFTAVDAQSAELSSRYSAAVNPNDATLASLLGGVLLSSAAGSLEILAVTAGTAEIRGAYVQRTTEIPAGLSLPVGEFNEGNYSVVMRYADGKTEEKKVEIRPEQTVRLRFNYRPPERLNTLGASAGFTFSAPVFAVAIQGTWAPGRGSFFDLGLDLGLGSGQPDIDYVSLYPYVRYAFFVPFTKDGLPAQAGWYAGAGLGLMVQTFTFPGEGKITGTNVAADLSTGFILRSGITFSYTLRTDFATANSKVAVGYSYRFKERGKK